MSRHYAVFGHPVAHSLSPRIHAAFARQAGIDMDYSPIDTEALDAALAAFDGDGANVTLPHKQRAAELCVSLGERARRCGVVNTLVRVDGGWHGENTDGLGLVRDLTDRHRLDLRGRRTLLLGAGGGARGVAPALLDAGIAELWIVNRTPEKADALADAQRAPDRVHTRYWADLPNLGAFDTIVNATSAGRGDGGLTLPFSLAAPRALAVDLSYGEAAIPFLAWAGAARCEYRVDGLGMLVEQAAEAFALWHGVRPHTDPVYDALSARSDVLTTAD